MATRDAVSELAKAETEATGTGPVHDGTAAVAQSLLDKQKNLAAKIDEVVSKPAEEVTQQDASELQSRQDRALGIDARTPGSLAAQVQQQADLNKKLSENKENAGA